MVNILTVLPSRSMIYHHSLRTLILTIILSGLTWGCTSTSDSADSTPQHDHSEPEPRSLILWHALRDQERDNLLADLRAFEEETKIKVRALELPHSAFANKLQVSIPRGNGPDLFIGAHDRVGDWAEAGLVEPLSFWSSPRELSSYLTPAIEAFTYQQQLYGLPLSCKALALFYQPELVAHPPETTDELFAMARAAKNDEVWGLAYPELDSLYFHAPWLHAHGGRVIDAGTPLLSNSPMRESVDLVSSLRREGLIPPEVNGALASELFRTKRLAFLINGPWFIAELKQDQKSGKETGRETGKETKTESDFKWAVAPLPKLSSTGAPLAPYLSVEGVMLSARARQPQQALKLARFLASPKRAESRMARGEVVAHRDVPAQALSRAPAWLQVFHRQVSASVPLSNHPLMKSLWTPAQRALAQSIIYEGDSRSALEGAQRDVLKSIKIATGAESVPSGESEARQ